MLKNQRFMGPWGPGGRENKIIFIGRGMKQRREELTDGFKACLVRPLRFKVGAEVQAKTGPGEDDYENGYIASQWEECNAYCIRLLSGEYVQAPHDDDKFVRRAP